ncbi:MAG TPA: T9SS type A sorting domain-containing protein, partial [Bacteroidia bacterium]|nr:T9SS type A sorting domain-containing protein [Bacteroidia bacterium]
WQKTIGADTSDQLTSIEQTSEGGYILGGFSNSNISGDKNENSNGNFDYWIVKIDFNGSIQWQNTIGGNNDDILAAIHQTSDGGYIIGGFSASNISGDKTENSIGDNDYWIVKTDSTGIIQWQNTIGGSDDDRLYAITQTTDGGYIIGGYSRSNISGDKLENCSGYSDYWILKTDSLGNIQWQNTIGGSSVDQLEVVLQTTDGGYMLGGRSTSNISGDKTENCNGAYDYWIVKTDSIGSIVWQNTIGGNNNDFFSDIKQTTDSGYILAGYSTSSISGDKTDNSNGIEDYWILKTDAIGNIQWQNTIGGNNSDVLNSIEQTSDGGFMLGGWSRSDISGDKTEYGCFGTNDYWIVKTDSIGNILWQNTIGGSDYDQLYSAQQTNDGGYILGGYSSSTISCDKSENSYGFFDYWLVKLFPDTITGISDYPSTSNALYNKIYPNPTSNTLNIIINKNEENIIIKNLLGEIVMEHTVFKDDIMTSEINILFLSSGIYFAKIGNEVLKFIKL